jgi:hypothetical protein
MSDPTIYAMSISAGTCQQIGVSVETGHTDRECRQHTAGAFVEASDTLRLDADGLRRLAQACRKAAAHLDAATLRVCSPPRASTRQHGCRG